MNRPQVTTFAAWLRAQLKERGWSPEQLAVIHAHEEMSTSAVYRLLTGKRKPHGATLRSIERALGVNWPGGEG